MSDRGYVVSCSLRHLERYGMFLVTLLLHLFNYFCMSFARLGVVDGQTKKKDPGVAPTVAGVCAAWLRY